VRLLLRFQGLLEHGNSLLEHGLLLVRPIPLQPPNLALELLDLEFLVVQQGLLVDGVLAHLHQQPL
jgi:hypothetical protein